MSQPRAAAAPRRTREDIRTGLKELLKKFNMKDLTKAKDDATNALVQFPFLRATESSTRLQSGMTVRTLKLAGTVGMRYKDKEYFIPCAVHITEEYPKRGPIAYIEPTATMIIKQQHKHVDQQGLCYLPYLHEWNKKSSHIIGCIEALAEVFSSDPFIYSKPAAQPAAQPAPQPVQPPPVPARPPYQYPTWQPPAPGMPPYMTAGGPPNPYGTQQQPAMPAYAAPAPAAAAMGGYATGGAAGFGSMQMPQIALGAERRPSMAEGPVDMAKRVEELESKLQEDKLCVVCISEPKNALIVPCGHVAMCIGCAEHLRTTGKTCPVCRGNIQQLVKAFVV